MTESTSIILAGVGGKGVITITNVLSHGLVAHGYDVKVSEVYGMSQRGGSVHAQVRFGTTIYSPLSRRELRIMLSASTRLKRCAGAAF